jgi:hypothetical protein
VCPTNSRPGQLTVRLCFASIPQTQWPMGAYKQIVLFQQASLESCGWPSRTKHWSYPSAELTQVFQAFRVHGAFFEFAGSCTQDPKCGAWPLTNLTLK